MSPVSARVVVWDSRCSFCRRSVQAMAALDWLGVHRFVGSAEPGALDDPRITRADAHRAVQLLTPSGRHEGFDAIRRILLRCPATCWGAPLLWLPPVRALGDRIYRRVAERRSCSLDVGQQPPVRSGNPVLWLVLLVAVQVLVPLWALGQGVPHRFGFHMFTGHPGSIVEVVDDAGETVDVDLSRWQARPRAELDWGPALAEAICRDVPVAAEVRITRYGELEVVPCDG